MAAKKPGRDASSEPFLARKPSGSAFVDRTYKTGAKVTSTAKRSWSPKDIKPAAPRRSSRPPSDRGQEPVPGPGFLVIEAEEAEAILPHQMTDAEIRSMDEAADANRGKPTAGSIRKL